MPVTTYAQVLTDDHPFWQAYLDGSKPTPPGRALREVLLDTGGLYEDTIELPDRVMVDIRQEAAAEPNDLELAQLARSGKVWISLENFRGLDMNTQVIYGLEFGRIPRE